MIANITVGRAIQALDKLHGYVDGNIVKQLYQELIGSADGANLDAILTQLDIQAAQTRGTDCELEHTEMFCIQRDYQYATMSRRALYQNAYQEKLRQAYELFMAFARENRAYDLAGILQEGLASPSDLTALVLNDYQVPDFSI